MTHESFETSEFSAGGVMSRVTISNDLSIHKGWVLNEIIWDWSSMGRAAWFSFASMLERGGYNGLLPPRAMAIRQTSFLQSTVPPEE